MKCVILAAGLGSRLDPLTRELPKPLMPVVNKPVLEHAIRAAVNAGCTEILINTHYLSEVVQKRFGSGAEYGVTITWRYETSLTGPAGALLAFEDLLTGDDPVLVVSGDTIHDFDLAQFICAHRNLGTRLSVLMKLVENPGRYGVGTIGSSGLLEAFVEKPALPVGEQRTVSCGIYCLQPALIETFPRGQIYDFGAHLIPAMIASRQAVHGVEMRGYWSDIGTPETLHAANIDAITAKVSLDFDGDPIDALGTIHVATDAQIDTSAKVTGPVLIGAGSRIGEEVEIVGPAVIGPECGIEHGAYLRNCVVLPGSTVTTNAMILSGLAGSRHVLAANG